MLLENRFSVPVPIDQAWPVLLDVQRVAACMPGATLDSMSGDQFEGRVKVKVGPIAMSFKGTAQFVEKDPAGHRAILQASGKEIGGTGTAKATMTMRLHDCGAESEVEITTDLAITGKAARFGRGVIADFAGRLVDQFASVLAAELAGGGDPAPDGAAAGAAVPGTVPGTVGDRRIAAGAGTAVGSTQPGAAGAGTLTLPPAGRPSPRPAPEAIDLVQSVGVPLLKRIAAPLIGIVTILLLRRRRRRRQGNGLG